MGHRAPTLAGALCVAMLLATQPASAEDDKVKVNFYGEVRSLTARLVHRSESLGHC